MQGKLLVEHLSTATVFSVVAAHCQFVDHLPDQFMCRYDLDLLASQWAFQALLEVMSEALLAVNALAARALVGV